jgi:hypothetical protein
MKKGKQTKEGKKLERKKIKEEKQKKKKIEGRRRRRPFWCFFGFC